MALGALISLSFRLKAPARGVKQEAKNSNLFRDIRLRIPTEAGRVFRRDAGQRSDLKPATVPN
jgi:hypothetical protein